MGRDSAGKAYFTRLFEQYHQELYAYAFSKLRDSFAAEEIVQNTFIRYWQKKGNEETENPSFFLFFIAKGLLIDQLRKKNSSVPLEEAHLSPADNILYQKYERLHNRRLVEQMATTLPRQQRRILEMNYQQDLSHDAIASALNISPKTVKNLLARAVRKLREQQRFSH